MRFRFLKRINANSGLFNGHFIDAKTLYVLRFNSIPCVTFIGDMDVINAFAYLTKTFDNVISATYYHSYFDHDDKNIFFNNSILVLQEKRIIEIADTYCQILYGSTDYTFASKLANDLAQFRIERNKVAFSHTHVVGFAKPAEMN